MKNIKKIKQLIYDAHSIAVCGHVNPDGDCVGSLLALGLGLVALGKKVSFLLQDPVPEKYIKLPGANKIRRSMKKSPDLSITVDCNAVEMIGTPYKIMRKAPNFIEIDHHAYRKPFGNISLIDTKAAAVGEIVYVLLNALKVEITQDIAQNILTSIIVETNSFRLPAVRPLTFRISGKMVSTGVDFYKLSDMIYWSKTKQVAILSGICMSNLIFLHNDKIAWSMIREKDFSKIKGKEEDVDAVADEIRSIDTVKIAILFRETRAGDLRVSLRSKDGINIAQVANKHGGGGHFDCAGCNLDNNRASMDGLIKESEKLLK